MKKLFTERKQGSKPRVTGSLDEVSRQSLLDLLKRRIDEHWFGHSFPEKCRDGHRFAGTEMVGLKKHMLLCGVVWPNDVSDDNPPSNDRMFDLFEYSYELIAEPNELGYHSYMQHYHYGYDQDAGREKFTQDVNRIFERNGVAYELTDGEIRRFASAVLHESLATPAFETRDAILDELMEVARSKFLIRSFDTRCESLEKIWDAWERLKNA